MGLFVKSEPQTIEVMGMNYFVQLEETNYFGQEKHN
jgi:hypothetical protein